MTSKMLRSASRSSGGVAATNGTSRSAGMSSVARLHQIAQVEQAPCVDDVALVEAPALGDVVLAQLIEKQGAQVRGHVVLHFDADDLAEAPLEHLLLDRREQVFRLFDGNVEIGIPRDSEHVRRDDFHSRERAPEVRADDLLERHEVVRPRRARESSAAGSSAPSRARSESRRRVGSRISTASESERFEMYGNGCPGSTASGVSTGKICDSKYSSISPHSAAREVAHAEETDVVRRGLVEKRREAAALHRAQARDLGVDRVELLLRGETVRRRQDDAGRDLTPQSRDANHVELVEVRAEDREELDALEQRHTRVERLVAAHAR